MRPRTRHPHTARATRASFRTIRWSAPILARGLLAEVLLNRPPVRLEHSTGVDTVIDWDELRERLCGDEALVETIVDLFVDECPGWLATIIEAVDAGDSERVRASAHALKGAAGNLLAHAVTAAAGRLERMAREGNFTATSAACAELSAEIDPLMGTLRAPRVH